MPGASDSVALDLNVTSACTGLAVVDSKLQHRVKLGILLPQRINTPHGLSRMLEGNRSSFVCKQMNKKTRNCVKKVLAHYTQDLPLFLGCHHSPFIPFCFTFPLLFFLQHIIVLQSAWVLLCATASWYPTVF